MKKILLISLLLSSVTLAISFDIKNCVVTVVDERTNILSCQSGDYLVKYKRDKKEKLADNNPITKLGDKCIRAEELLQYIQKH